MEKGITNIYHTWLTIKKWLNGRMGLYFPSSKTSLNGCCDTVLIINKLGARR